MLTDVTRHPVALLSHDDRNLSQGGFTGSHVIAVDSCVTCDMCSNCEQWPGTRTSSLAASAVMYAAWVVPIDT